ncbi:MAG TPA: amidohydrolase family protein [Vitreimonas sp.]|jgi:predicted TIM-barrel fold metal-dependent hydrolase|nr:amidohydrolase family protein [Vitreimonas sp.]
MRLGPLSLVLFLPVFVACAAPRAAELPVIDMHLHAMLAADQGPPPLGVCLPVSAEAHDPQRPWGEAFAGLMKNPPCADPLWSPETDEALRDQTLAELDRLNVIAVLSGPRERVAEWRARSPERIVAGHQYMLGRETYSPEEMAAYFSEGGFSVLAEVGNQYVGAEPDDPRFAGFWRMAEELDIPVGIHIGTGPPGSAHLFSGYRARLHSPLLLEEVLMRHPRLRVYIMHAGWPMRDDLLALLWAHPQVYVDTGALQMALPRAEYYDFLETLVRAGFHERIMFGSDQMIWPGLIEEGISAIREAPFLTEQQKRDILYNNAARFLRLSEDEIARHHRHA